MVSIVNGAGYRNSFHAVNKLPDSHWESAFLEALAKIAEQQGIAKVLRCAVVDAKPEHHPWVNRVTGYLQAAGVNLQFVSHQDADITIFPTNKIIDIRLAKNGKVVRNFTEFNGFHQAMFQLVRDAHGIDTRQGSFNEIRNGFFDQVSHGVAQSENNLRL